MIRAPQRIPMLLEYRMLSLAETFRVSILGFSIWVVLSGGGCCSGGVAVHDGYGGGFLILELL